MKRAVVLGLLVSRAALAQPTDAPDSGDHHDDATSRAREADRAGREHYARHDYAAARDDYQRAHDAMPDPLFVFDMAQASRLLGDCARASELYRRYLHDQPDADDRERVEQFIIEMDACAASHRARPPVAAAAPPPSSSSPNVLQLTGVGTAALGLLLVGAGVYFSIDASDSASMLEAACAHGCAGADVASLDRTGQESSRDAITTYILGGAALAAGASMFVWATFHAGDEPPAVAPVVAPTAGGATVSARVRF